MHSHLLQDDLYTFRRDPDIYVVASISVEQVSLRRTVDIGGRLDNHRLLLVD